MSVSSSVLVSLGAGLAKWLAKRYLGDLNEELAGDLIDLGKDKITDLIERRNAARQFERYADEILKRIMQSLETRRKNHPELDDDAICGELSETLNGRITEHYLVAKDLDPRVIAADLRQRRPLPTGRLPELETRVYEQVLDEIVRYILEVASLLPSFQSAVAAESLKRLSNLGQDVTDVLNTVQRLESRVIESDNKTPDARWEADYRAAVIRTLDRVELFGADIPPEAQRNLLTEAFVSLNVATDRDDAEEARGDATAIDERSAFAGLFTVEELLSRTESDFRLLIRGSAGCGKTTLLRWAAIQAASRRYSRARKVDSHAPVGTGFTVSPYTIVTNRHVLELQGPDTRDDWARDDWARAYGDEELKADRLITQTKLTIRFPLRWFFRIPFFVPLRNCQDGKLPAPEDLPLLIAKEVGRPQPGWVRTVLTEGRALVMLDGVDEVPSQNRGLLKDEIEALVMAYPDCMFVLTSRPTAIPDDWLKELGFLNADVSPMSMLDVERFVKRWHEATGKELARQGRTDANLATDAERLTEQFSQNPPLSLLATNPLLCAMICALHRVRHHKLPESQYELCETLCHMLLHKRERESHLNWQEFPAAYIALTYEQKRGIAQQLAQWLVHNGQSAMPLEVAYEQVARALQRIPGRTPDEAPLILKTLVERSGLLREPNLDVVDFLHNTFKELLAGDDLAVRGDAESVMQHLDDESWRRVALFGVASPRSQTFADLLVERVLGHIRNFGGSPGLNTASTVTKKRPKTLTRGHASAADIKALRAVCKKDKSLLRTVLFALQCRRVAAGTFLDQKLASEIDQLVSVPFPPAGFESAEAIAQLGDDAIDLLVTPRRLTAKQATATARALRLINTAKSRAEFRRRFVESTNWDVLTELAQVIDPLSIPSVVSALQDWKSLPDSIRPLICDLSPLRGLADVQTLDLNDCPVTDLGPLAGLERLSRLHLKGTPISDLRPLSDLQSLQILELSDTSVEDLSPIAGLTCLQILELNGTSVTDLVPLGRLTDLQALNLNGTKVDDLTPIAGLKNLKMLSLYESAVTDLSPLANLTRLQQLSLDRTHVTNLRPLASLFELEVLGLNASSVTDVSPLAALSNLRVLWLMGTGVKDISMLSHLTELRIFGIEEDAKLKPEGPGSGSSTSTGFDSPLDDDVSVPLILFHLVRLDLANWRGFERRTFEFSGRVTVLIGNNGTGKSSSLEAVAVALASWCGGRVISDADLRRVTVGDTATPRVITSDRTSVRCAAMWNGESFDWLRLWENRGPQSESLDSWWAAAQKARRQLANGVNVMLPVIAYYPASRIWRDVRLAAQETQSAGSPWDGYIDCFAPAADIGELKRFMKTRQWFVLQAQRPAHDLEAVQKAVVAAIGRTEFAADRRGSHIDSTRYGVGARDSNLDLVGKADAASDTGVSYYRVNRFEYDVQLDELMIGFDDGRRLPFGMLSDGQRTTIALVADIARRAATLNPHLGAEAAAQSPGIVLIDEIELHLHPRWQRTIVGDLRDTFPLMQFVITTHSPLIIQSCRKGEVMNLDDTNDDPTDNAELCDFTLMSPEDILELEQGMSLPSRSQRMLEMKKAAEQYYAALRKAESTSDEDRERLKQRLDELEEPFTDDPAFSAFLRLKRAAAGLED